MGTEIKGYNVIGPVVPFNTSDIYATHIARYGNGGLRTVKNLTERDDISLERRDNLMIVGVEDDSYDNSDKGVAYYVLDINNQQSTSTDLLDNNNWFPINMGYGTDNWVFPTPNQSNYPGKKGQRSYDDNYYYTCVEDNLWKRVAIDWFMDTTTGGWGGNTGGTIPFGSVPYWNNSDWGYTKVIKDSTYDSLSGELSFLFTDNTTKLFDLSDNANILSWTLPSPLSGNYAGTKGDVSYDDNFFYICIADNNWKRINIDEFGFTLPVGSGTPPLLSNGDVYVWDNTNHVFNGVKVIKDVVATTVSGNAGHLFTYTDNTTTFLQVGTGTGSNLTFRNGLTADTTNAELGGVLIKDTSVDISTYSLALTSTAETGLLINNTSAILDSSNAVGGLGGFFAANTTGLTIYSANNSGVKYLGDYTQTWTNDSSFDNYLATKKYVDSAGKMLYKQVNRATVTGTGGYVDYNSFITNLGSDIGSPTFLANSFDVGDTVSIKMRGYINISADSNMTFRLHFGSNVIVTSASFQIASPKVNNFFELDFEFTVLSLGTAGTIIGQGNVKYLSTGNASYFSGTDLVMTNPVSVNTTINSVLSIEMISTILSGDMQITNLTIRKE
jgi:hypothetical protein